jgi:hypothetical protein
MRPRTFLVAIAGLSLVFSALPASAQLLPDDAPTHPDPAFLPDPVPARACTVENEYEAAQYGLEIGDLIYDEGCRRIRFAFGPIVVKPGENDALIEPVTIEKPAYDGYVTRFQPDLLRAVTGDPPLTDELHVHHATWLTLAGNSYGSGPFAASGEEKTIRSYPRGYGMQVGATDRWQLLYMLHSDTIDPEVVWLTYDIDFIDEATAENVHGIVNTRPIWRDVMTSPMPHPDMINRGGNPIFNVHRGFGDIDPETGRQVCVWPKQNCARSDYYKEVSVHQGLPGPDADTDVYDESIKGTDWLVTAGFEGTLVHGGGHVHPGGMRVDMSLVREIDGEWVEKPLITSDAVYWDWEDPEKAGARPISWNFSMTVNNADLGWKVKIKEGDLIRLNGVYDTEDGSWYGQMGILNIHVAVDDPHDPPGVDLFEDDVEIHPGVATDALIPEGPYDAKTGWRPERCEPDLTGESGQKRLCLRGWPTHGHLHESGHFGGGSTLCPEEGPGGACPELEYIEGELTTEIVSAGFTFGNADLGVINTPGLGMPLLKVNEPARFWNYDTAARIWHTFTRCAYPCNGPPDLGYPISNGGSGDPWDYMDFDSGELGYGTMLDQTKSQPVTGQGNKSPQEWVRDGLYWEFTPTETGVFTFWCRTHRGMRGAFKVVE